MTHERALLHKIFAKTRNTEDGGAMIIACALPSKFDDEMFRNWTINSINILKKYDNSLSEKIIKPTAEVFEHLSKLRYLCKREPSSEKEVIEFISQIPMRKQELSEFVVENPAIMERRLGAKTEARGERSAPLP